jgi:hypothetical protein
MTRKDHKTIANVLRHARERGEQPDRICEYFALVLQQDNSRFNKARFFKNAGYEPEVSHV